MYNLATGLKQFKKDFPLNSDGWVELMTDNLLESLLEKGKTNLCLNNDPIFHNDGYWFVTKNGVNCKVYASNHSFINEKSFKQNETIPPSYVLLPGDKEQKLFILINGDEDSYQVDLDSKYKQLTISFNCLSQFYIRKTSKERNVDRKLEIAHIYTCAQKFTDGTLKIVDYEADSKIELKPNHKKAIAGKMTEYDAKQYLAKVKASPGAGYTYMHRYSTGGYWHKSSTTLIYDKVANISFIFGQDEGTYFACQLVDNPKTVADAYISLQPEEVRGTNSKRQGEWFLLKTEKPSVSDCVLETCEEYSDRLSLGRDDENSARHKIKSYNIVVDKSGSVYAHDPTLTHENGDHVDVSEKGWVKFCRNTAVFSVSAEGVD